MNLNGVLIGTGDPQRLTEYYTELFGKPGWEEGGYTGWRLGSGYITIGAHSEVRGKNEDPGRVIWNLETPDVKVEFERLKEAGAVVVREPYMPEGMPEGVDAYIATLSDPDGNYFQLISPMGPDA